MSGAELGLAVVGTADLCMRYAMTLVEKYQAFRGARGEIDDKILVLENLLKRTDSQMKFLKQVWDTLDPEYQDLQERNYGVLLGKLHLAIRATERLEIKHSRTDNQASSSGWSRRLLYAMFLKEPLENSIRDVKEWQSFFEPSWYLILRDRNSIINDQLRRSAEESPSLMPIHRLHNALRSTAAGDEVSTLDYEMSSALKKSIEFSTARIVKFAKSSQELILDIAEYDEFATRLVSAEDVQELARKLKYSNPHLFHILNCVGIIEYTYFGGPGIGMTAVPTGRRALFYNKRKPRKRLVLAFQQPEGTGSPRSLRSLLISPAHAYSVSDRVRAAIQLAKSISFVHMYGFVHKNVRPEEILIFQDKESELGSLCLIGFKIFRSFNVPSSHKGDDEWHRNIYRHPERRGRCPQKDHQMLHDVYSLGICLLEIGLWKTFVTYRSRSVGIRGVDASPTEILGVGDEENPVVPSKEHFIILAKERLPEKMGNVYTEIVVTCLTYTEDGRSDEMERAKPYDRLGVVEGVRYIEKILMQLEKIHV